MEITSNIITTTGTLTTGSQIVLDKPLQSIKTGSIVKLIIMAESDDIDEQSWFQSAKENNSFDFLNDENEDIYSLADGVPFHDKE